LKAFAEHSSYLIAETLGIVAYPFQAVKMLALSGPKRLAIDRTIAARRAAKRPRRRSRRCPPRYAPARMPRAPPHPIQTVGGCRIVCGAKTGASTRVRDGAGRSTNATRHSRACYQARHPHRSQLADHRYPPAQRIADPQASLKTRLVERFGSPAGTTRSMHRPERAGRTAMARGGAPSTARRTSWARSPTRALDSSTAHLSRTGARCRRRSMVSHSSEGT
jgi:hypothetical protein